MPNKVYNIHVQYKYDNKDPSAACKVENYNLFEVSCVTLFDYKLLIFLLSSQVTTILNFD